MTLGCRVSHGFFLTLAISWALSQVGCETGRRRHLKCIIAISDRRLGKYNQKCKGFQEYVSSVNNYLFTVCSFYCTTYMHRSATCEKNATLESQVSSPVCTCFVGLPSLPLHWNMRFHQGLPGNLMLLKKVTGTRALERLAKVLNGSRARHDGTVCKCVHGGSNFIVTEAYQVRNLHLWRRYHRCIRSICGKHRQTESPLNTHTPLTKQSFD